MPTDLRPVADVLVTVPGTTRVARTNAGGAFSFGELPVPAVGAKLAIAAVAPGFGAWSAQVPAVPGDEVILRVMLHSVPFSTDIPSHAEVRAARIAADSAAPAAIGGGGRFGMSVPLGGVVPPAASCQGYTSRQERPRAIRLYTEGTVVTLNLNEYIKGVLGIEWGSGSPPESLRAGAAAATAWAWYQILHHEPGHTTPQGQCYDVENSQGDQVYNPAYSTDKTDRAVDYAWNFNMQLNDGPFYSQYRAFLVTDGEGCGAGIPSDPEAGEWMSQDGANACASSGKTWIDILKLYYYDLGASITFDLAYADHFTGDFDGDHREDFAVWRPQPPGTLGADWQILYANGGQTSLNYGQDGDTPVPADYDGDGRTDLGIFRPTLGGTDWYAMSVWYGTEIRTKDFGQPNDIPVQGDYDGDGSADFAVFRPSSSGSDWFIAFADVAGSTAARDYGTVGDTPVPADYDGDGRTDLGIWRPSSTAGVPDWYLKAMSGLEIMTKDFGQPRDYPVPGNYDTDGEVDLAVFRPSSGADWYRYTQAGATLTPIDYGQVGDIPIAADFDGSGVTDDLTVWRPSSPGVDWYSRSSLDGATSTKDWGRPGDIPA